MKTNTAKAILCGFWWVVCIVYLLLFAIKTPQFGSEAAEVWKIAPSFVSPILALLVSYFFGAIKITDEPLERPLAFGAALLFSFAHVIALFTAVFFFKGTMVENLKRAGIFMGVFSGITIIALNHFLIGIVAQTRRSVTRKSASNKEENHE